MWKVLFYIAVLVTVSKASSQYTNDLPLVDITNDNLLNKIGLLADKYTLVLNNLKEIISGLFLGQPATQLNLNKLKSCPPCSCGALGYKEKIIGGREVQHAHKYPWMALLLSDNGILCGASLINDKYVLTAAHCVDTLQANNYKVRLSVHDRNVDIFEEYNAKSIIIHERYSNFGILLNDIALIRLDTDGVKMNEDVHPVCMPKKGLSYANVLGVATGWGLMDRGDYNIPAKVLREVKLHVLSNRECTLYWPFLLTPNMVCAGLRHEGKSPCFGDSGGPLTVANGSVHHIIGVTSFVKDETCRKPPSVYTRVTEYLDWIKANTEDACPCDNN